MTGPLAEGDLALVHGPLVRVIAIDTERDGAVVRDDTGYQTWLPTGWLMRLPVNPPPNGGRT